MKFVKNAILLTLMYGTKLIKPIFITEIASTHGGSESELKKLVKAINSNTSDYVKLQIFSNKNLCHKSSIFYKGLERIELSYSFWKKIITDIKTKKIILEPFDEESYIFCKQFKERVLLKISASEHDNVLMINDAVKNFKKVFFNISGYKLKEISKLFQNIKIAKKKVILMYGFQSFPSNPKDLRMGIINEIKKAGFEAGYADHTETTSLIGTYITTANALDLGARYIEKHITLDRKKKKPDYITSFNPSDFQDYVNFFKLKYLDAYKKKK